MPPTLPYSATSGRGARHHLHLRGLESDMSAPLAAAPRFCGVPYEGDGVNMVPRQRSAFVQQSILRWIRGVPEPECLVRYL